MTDNVIPLRKPMTDDEATICALRDFLLMINEHRHDAAKVGHLVAEALDVIDGEAKP